jgi:hypothetical protein
MCQQYMKFDTRRLIRYRRTVCRNLALLFRYRTRYRHLSLFRNQANQISNQSDIVEALQVYLLLALSRYNIINDYFIQRCPCPVHVHGQLYVHIHFHVQVCFMFILIVMFMLTLHEREMKMNVGLDMDTDTDNQRFRYCSSF